jgi:hypothetical protein
MPGSPLCLSKNKPSSDKAINHAQAVFSTNQWTIKTNQHITVNQSFKKTANRDKSPE